MAKRRPDRKTKTQEPAGKAASARTWFVLVFPVLWLVTLLAYQPAWHGGLLWDDSNHVTAPVLSAPDGIWRSWFEFGATEQYYPVVYSTLWVLHLFFGNDTTGYHIVNITFHAGLAFLFWLILRRLKVPGAELAAAIFALHPIQVESVAWITEMKNTLSGVFFAAAALAYLSFDTSRKARDYLLAMGLFVLALFGKANTATLPAGLLAVFWWQRGRLDWRRDVMPMVPFFAVGLAVGLTVTWVEYLVVGAGRAEFLLTPIDRVLIAGRAVWFYLGKFFWPVGFTFSYPRWQINAGVWWQYLYPLALAALVVALWRLRTWSRAPIAALAYFVVTLSPALSIVNLYYTRYSFVADHFQYLASFGTIALCAAGVVLLARRWRVAAPQTVAVLVICVPLACLTWVQAHEYADGETLFRATIARNPGSWMAHNNLGYLLDESGRSAEAIPHFEEAVRLQPRFAPPFINLGSALLHQGKTDEAVRAFREAVRLEAGNAKAHAGLGHALAVAGHPDEALVHLTESVRLDPKVEEAHNNLGVVYDGMGRTEDAIKEYTAALAINPEWAEARNNLGAAFASSGRLDEAVVEFEHAIRINPGYVEARRNLGLARYYIAAHLLEKGATADAVRQLEAAVHADPDNAAARRLLEKIRR